jgi:hypothetical protein
MAQQQRNFLQFKVDFEKETGLKLKDNMPVYISYYQMRLLEGVINSMGVTTNFLANVIRETKQTRQSG